MHNSDLRAVAHGSPAGAPAPLFELRSIVDMIRCPVLVLDEAHKVVSASRSFCRRFAVAPGDIEGRHLCELFEGALDTPAVSRLLSDVLAGRTEPDTLEVECDLPGIGQRVMVLDTHRLLRGPTDVPMILLTMEDITDLRRAERRLAAEHAVTRVLAEARSFDEAAPRVLDAFCTELGVEMAELWAPSDDGRYLALAAFHLAGEIEGAAAFREVTTGVNFAPGVGLPGRVWQAREPAWIKDVTHDPNFLRVSAAADLGLCTGFAFPILAGETCFGVMSFFTRDALAPDLPLLEMMAAIGRDIGQFVQRTRAEEAVCARDRRLRRVLDNLFAFVGMLTPEGIVIEANRAPLEAAGITLEDVRGKRFEDCYWWSYSKAVQARLRNALERAAQGETVRYDVDVRMAGGRLMTIDFMLAPLRDDEGEITHLIPSAIDITERKRLTEERFQAFLDATPDAMVVVSQDCTIRVVNRQAEQLFGYSRDELVGQQVEALMPERFRKRHLEHQRVYFANPDARTMGADLDILGLTRDGREVPLEVSLSPVPTDQGAMSAVAAARDITERRRSEAELQAAKDEAERVNALKSRFLAATSHDLRQPLQTLRLLQGVLSRTVADGGSRRIVQDLGQTIGSMADTVDTLLDIDRLERGTVEPEVLEFPANSALLRVQSDFRPLAEAKGLDLRVVPSSSMVRTDPRLLDRLVENLVSNAIKYTDAGKVLLGCRRRGASLSIEVWDSGIGIPPDELASIFEEYYQIDNPALERRRGLGLGLALVQRIAELLGHRMEVRSTYGKGSMFALAVPLAGTGSDVRRRVAPFESVPKTAGEAAVVLLVEDDVSVRASLGTFLKLEGYAVSAAGIAREALALVEEGGVRPAIVVADRNLPGGMSGPAFCRELGKLTHRAIPAIVLTGDSSSETAREIAESGAEHVRKPVEPEKLAALMQHLLRRQPEAAALPLPTPVGGLPEEKHARKRATIHVIDDDPAVRRAMHALLDRLGYEVETYPTAETFLDAYRAHDLECLLVDVSMPGMNGLQLQERLNEQKIAVPVIVMTGRQEVPVAVQAMRAGAVDFLDKPVSGERLLEALERALERGAKSADAASARAEIEGRFGRLTLREREVLKLVVEGLSNKEVAARLGISPRTAENHRARIMEKTSTRSLAELVRTALSADDVVDLAE